MGDELGGARVDGLERRADALLETPRPHRSLTGAGELGDPPVGEPELLGAAQHLRVGERARGDRWLEGDDLAHVLEEPGVHPGQRANRLGREAGAVRVADREDPVGVRNRQQPSKLVVTDRPTEGQTPAILLERAQ